MAHGPNRKLELKGQLNIALVSRMLQYEVFPRLPADLGIVYLLRDDPKNNRCVTTKFDLHEFRFAFAFLLETDHEIWKDCRYSAENFQVYVDHLKDMCSTDGRYGHITDMADTALQQKMGPSHEHGNNCSAAADQPADGAVDLTALNESQSFPNGHVQTTKPVDYDLYESEVAAPHNNAEIDTVVADESLRSVASKAAMLLLKEHTANTNAMYDTNDNANQPESNDDGNNDDGTPPKILEPRINVEKWIKMASEPYMFGAMFPSVYCPVKDHNGAFFVPHEFRGLDPGKVAVTDFRKWSQLQMWRPDGLAARHPVVSLYLHAAIEKQSASSSISYLLSDIASIRKSTVEDSPDKATALAEKIRKNILMALGTLRSNESFWLNEGKDVRNLCFELLEQGLPPSGFITLTMADWHCPWLRRQFAQHYDHLSEMGASGGVSGATILADDSPYWNALHVGDHITTTFFDLRVRAYFEQVLVPHCGVQHFWYRYEFGSGRGKIHIHGILWGLAISDGPGSSVDITKVIGQTLSTLRDEVCCRVKQTMRVLHGKNLHDTSFSLQDIVPTLLRNKNFMNDSMIQNATRNAALKIGAALDRTVNYTANIHGTPGTDWPVSCGGTITDADLKLRRTMRRDCEERQISANSYQLANDMVLSALLHKCIRSYCCKKSIPVFKKTKRELRALDVKSTNIRELIVPAAGQTRTTMDSPLNTSWLEDDKVCVGPVSNPPSPQPLYISIPYFSSAFFKNIPNAHPPLIYLNFSPQSIGTAWFHLRCIGASLQIRLWIL